MNEAAKRIGELDFLDPRNNKEIVKLISESDSKHKGFLFGSFAVDVLGVQSSVMRSFKYSHCHLRDDEYEQIKKYYGMPKDAWLSGGDVMSVVCIIETKEMVLDTVQKLNPIEVMGLINQIIKLRVRLEGVEAINELANKRKLERVKKE